MLLTSSPLYRDKSRGRDIVVTKQTTEDASLGREITLPARTHVRFNTGLYEIKFFTGTVEVEIHIGPHTAHLVMSRDAWELFLQGEPARTKSLMEYIAGE